MVTFYTSFLKVFYPTEFMAALLTLEKDNTDKLNGTLIQGGEVNIGGGNANSIMNTFRSGGSSHSINSIQHMPTVPNNSIVIQNVQTPVNNTAYNGQLPVNENMKSEATNNSESNI